MAINLGYLLGSAAVCALVISAPAVSAGGFALREQSASHQGASFAGSAAAGDLSSMFWNPAAAALKNGLNTESHYSVIVPHAEITVTSASHPTNPALNGTINSPAFGNTSGDIGSLAVLGASYMSYQFTHYDPNLFLGLSMNSPFGLKTDLDRSFDTYKGAVVGRETKLLTYAIAPTLAYRATPNLLVGAGVQFQYGKAVFSFATGPPNGEDTKFEGSGVTVGATAGLMWMPTASTTVGLGWRSQMSQEVQGAYINTPGTSVLGLRSVAASTTIELPNIVTLSLRQSLTSNTRLLGTVEWSNWSRLKELRLVSEGSSPAGTGVIIGNPNGIPSIGAEPGQVIGILPANWSDSWMFALGGEVDVIRQFTVRAGGAYEISPIDAPRKRLIGIPDNDRIWASVGATFKWSEKLSFDLAYTHLFVKESALDRDSLLGFNIIGNVQASTDIISVSIKSTW